MQSLDLFDFEAIADGVPNGQANSTSYPIHLLRPGAPAGALNKVAVTPEVRALLDREAAIAIGCSGGKDSDACALATSSYLDSIGHRGPRVLIHADLGRVEWKDSLPSCQRLAARLGWELIVVARKAGDMMARWEGRWKSNVARYQALECVKLILPWSTPSMRFCTSEMKSAVIAAALKKRFPDRDIINVTGVRRQESSARAKMPISAPHTGLTRKGLIGLTWNAIIEWPVQDVLFAIQAAGLRLHEAYTRYQTTRVSCAFCIMSSESDLLAAAGCDDNHDLYRLMVDLEARSTFAFQGARWLADVAAHLLSAEQLAQIAIAKAAASSRQQIEAQIPEHLLYTKGWPTSMPTWSEAELIAQIRREVSRLLSFESQFLTAETVRDRYAELLALKAEKCA